MNNHIFRKAQKPRCAVCYKDLSEANYIYHVSVTCTSRHGTEQVEKKDLCTACQFRYVHCLWTPKDRPEDWYLEDLNDEVEQNQESYAEMW